jgi:hypothetical protein
VTPGVPQQVIPRDPVNGWGVVAIESFGGTSGRFVVAEVSARLFPDVMANFISRVKEEGFPSPDFSKIRPYPDDQYTYVNPRLLEFLTPAHHDGIGTGVLEPSAAPVRGVVGLGPRGERETNLLQFQLAQALIELELQCMKSSRPSC